MIVSSFDPFRDLDRLLSPGNGTPLSVAMDVVRREDEVLVAVDLPGVAPDDVDLTVERNVVTLTAERHEPTGEGDRFVTRERRTGKVTRQLVLSDALDASRLEAQLSEGVLRLRIPVAEQAKPQRIEIAAGTPSRAIETSAS